MTSHKTKEPIRWWQLKLSNETAINFSDLSQIRRLIRKLGRATFCIARGHTSATL